MHVVASGRPRIIGTLAKRASPAACERIRWTPIAPLADMFVAVLWLPNAPLLSLEMKTGQQVQPDRPVELIHHRCVVAGLRKSYPAANARTGVEADFGRIARSVARSAHRAGDVRNL